MPKTIQIKNAQKFFKHQTFKLFRHDFLRFFDAIKNKITPKERQSLLRMDRNLRAKFGDYEIYIKVFPRKIEIIE